MTINHVDIVRISIIYPMNFFQTLVHVFSPNIPRNISLRSADRRSEPAADLPRLDK